MQLSVAIAMTRSHLDAISLTRYKIEVDNRKSRAGACLKTHFSKNRSLSTGIIYLSRGYVEAFSVDEMEQLIFHELGHAITPPECSAHGPEWRFNARSLGYKGKRTLDANSSRPRSKYNGTCPRGHAAGRERISHSSVYSCGHCLKAGFSRQASIIVWEHEGRYSQIQRPVVQSTPKPQPRAQGTTMTRPKTTVGRGYQDKYRYGVTTLDDMWDD